MSDEIQRPTGGPLRRAAGTRRPARDDTRAEGAPLRRAAVTRKPARDDTRTVSERPVRDDIRAEGEPALRTMAMPADTNPAGDIFGGWLLSQMDLAGGVVSRQRAGGRTATVALDAMVFHKPVLVGDLVSCYATVEKVGRTSITIHVEAWVERGDSGDVVQVTEGIFTYVAIGPDGRPRPVDGA